MIYIHVKLCIYAYIVPATRVLTCVTLSGKSFARPKSPILGLKFSSNNMLLALISLWTMFGWASSWRKLRPEAVPRQIVALFCQSRGTHLLFEPVKKEKVQKWKVWTAVLVR